MTDGVFTSPSRFAWRRDREQLTSPELRRVREVVDAHGETPGTGAYDLDDDAVRRAEDSADRERGGCPELDRGPGDIRVRISIRLEHLVHDHTFVAFHQRRYLP